MQIQKQITLPVPETAYEKKLNEELQRYSFKLSELLNGGLLIGEDNCNADIVTVADTGNADTEFTVAHSIKRVPVGFILIKTDKACALYDSGTAWTSSNIYLKSSVANCSITLIVI